MSRRQLPISAIKIDKSFVLDMIDNPDDATIVRSTVELARNLGLHVVAGGVETRAHWDRLAALGCHTGRGYHLTRPLPAGELAAWLERDDRYNPTVAAHPAS